MNQIIPKFKEIRSKHIAMLISVILGVSVCFLGYQDKIEGDKVLYFCGTVLTLCGTLADTKSSNKS